MRLDTEGVCVTVGNLIDFAWPESVANHMRIVTAVRAHRTNARVIGLLVAGGGSGDGISASVAVDHTGLLGATSAAMLASLELSAIDYRIRFGMADEAIMEVMMPTFGLGAIRADLANQMGLATKAVTNAMIADWFDLRGVRVQFVNDWQVRTGAGSLGNSTPAIDYPATISYLIYAPGTFVLGKGLSLDLGVIRDSVLNATNDHTAAWAEESYLVAKPGHESRIVTTTICNSGEVGMLSITCAGNQS